MFLMSSGVNVILDEAEEQMFFKQFVVDFEKAILWQVDQLMKEENFERMLQVTKLEKFSLRESDNSELSAVLEALMSGKGFDIAVEENSDNNLSAFFKFGADQGGQGALDKLGIEGIFGVTDDSWLKFLDDTENLLIASVDQTTKKWIAGTLQTGLENQLSNLEMRDLILTEAQGMSKERAQLIARTELANVMNQTELESYRRSKFTHKRWRTSRDERVCPICQPLDNLEIKIDDEFASLGRANQAPPIHPACRCFLQAIENDAWIIGGKRVWFGDKAGVRSAVPSKQNIFPVNLTGEMKESLVSGIKNSLRKLPASDLEGVNDIFIRNEVGPRGTAGGFRMADGNGQIDIWTQTGPRKFTNVNETLHHEIGHIVQRRWVDRGKTELLSSISEEFDRFVELPILRRNFQISEQILHGDGLAEFAAETYAQFRMFPDMLKRQHPNLFNLYKDELK